MKQTQWQRDHRKELNEYNRKWNKEHPNEIREMRRRSKDKNKILVLSHYGGNPPKCIICGFSDIRALSIDHINGGGRSLRKVQGTGQNFYYWLKRNNFPDGFQVLCMNCQFIKRDENGEAH